MIFQKKKKNTPLANRSNLLTNLPPGIEVGHWALKVSHGCKPINISGHLVNPTCTGMAVRDGRGPQNTLKGDQGSCGSYSELGCSSRQHCFSWLVPILEKHLENFKEGIAKLRNPLGSG